MGLESVSASKDVIGDLHAVVWLSGQGGQDADSGRGPVRAVLAPPVGRQPESTVRFSAGGRHSRVQRYPQGWIGLLFICFFSVFIS